VMRIANTSQDDAFNGQALGLLVQLSSTYHYAYTRCLSTR
jgi:hypothetical protein